MSAVLQFLNLLNPLSSNISTWYLIIKVITTAFLWWFAGLILSPDTAPVFIIISILVTILIWRPMIMVWEKTTSAPISPQPQTISKQNNNALLMLLDVLSPEERQIVRERLMDSVSKEQ